MPFIVQVARVRGTAQTVPFIVQGARIRDAQTVPSPSHPGIHARDSPRQVSVLPFICPCPSLHLWAAWGSLPWMCPGRLSALSSCDSLAPFLPTGGHRDANPPSNSGSSPRCLPVCAVSGQCKPNWRCPNCGGLGGHWYTEEVVPGECMANALQVDKQSWSAPGWDMAQA